MTSRSILLTAGGTGGHLFPAQALADELVRRGHVVDLATDERVGALGDAFPARKVHLIASATVKGRSPFALARTGWRLLRGTWQARGILKTTRPDVVVGFGGYPTFPPMFAAFLSKVPSILHEANAVMGRANRMLASRVDAIATSFPLTGDGASGHEGKLVQTGNPVREAVIAAAKLGYVRPKADGLFRLLVFGGSQGARFFSDAVPPALALMEPDIRARMKVVQQCRPEDLEQVRAAYDRLEVRCELAPFFSDMADRIAAAHLVVCRSGASSVSELAAIGRPAVLVPLPHALDNDQGRNAEVLAEAGGAWPVAQSELQPGRLAALLTELMAAPDRLADAAAAARSAGRPDAVLRLADLVEHIAGGGRVADFSQGRSRNGESNGDAS